MLDLAAWGYGGVDLDPQHIACVVVEHGETVTLQPSWLTKIGCWLMGRQAPPDEELIAQYPMVIVWLAGTGEPIRFEFADAMTIVRNRLRAEAFADYLLKAKSTQKRQGVEAIPAA